MDEQTAWESFCRTGSVEAYLHYSRLHRLRAGGQEAQGNAYRNGRAGHPGTAGGGERPAGDPLNPQSGHCPGLCQGHQNRPES